MAQAIPSFTFSPVRNAHVGFDWVSKRIMEVGTLGGHDFHASEQQQ
jgi:hypothetical protein